MSIIYIDREQRRRSAAQGDECRVDATPHSTWASHSRLASTMIHVCKRP